MEEVKKGRGLVLSVIGATIAIALFTDINYWIVIGFGDIARQIIRFSLTVLLCYFLYKGHKWAKVITIILSILAFFIIVFSGGFSVLLIIMGALYAYFAIALIVSKSVKSFMEHQKNKSYKTEFLKKEFDK